MKRNPRIASFGSWKSPITAEHTVGRVISFGQIALDRSDVWWSEMRPAESGRFAIRRWRREAVEDILPAPYSARSRVHEYGGGAFLVHDGTLYFSHDRDQCLYHLAPGSEPKVIAAGEDQRYADGVFDNRHRSIICVREVHGADREPVNAIVTVDAQGRSEARVLVAGDDFYANPRVNPTGDRMAWLSWSHPDMPWDGTRLWLADRDAQGRPVRACCIAGNREESVFQPEFAPDGTLYFVSDRSDWWNLYRYREGKIEALAPMAAEFGLPQWIFGQSTYAFDSPKRLVCTFTHAGRWRLGVLDTETLRFEEIETPYTDIGQIRAGGGIAVFIAATPASPAAVVRLDLTTRHYQTVAVATADVPDLDYLSEPRAVDFPTAGGVTAHAWYYPPANREYRGPDNEKPPLLVISHGGPTSATSAALNLRTQFWTSRGFAVLDVNYRGSTGYGRAYRRALDGQWGIADVEDCIAGARWLAQRGAVDLDRLIIRGGSAGGYTTLCALAYHEVFRAGAVYYGVSDLEALARDTHKFESRYLDRLVGPYPQEARRYHERSPIHSAQRLSCPVIFFQGLEDKVVPPDQTEKMVNALRVRNIPVAYIEFADEQHGFRRAETIRRALEAELYFYSRVFGFMLADPVSGVTVDNLSE